MLTQTGVPDWNLIRANQINSEPLRINLNQSEPTRKTFRISFDANQLIIYSRFQFELIRTKVSIRLNPNQSELGLIQTEFSISIILTFDYSFGLKT